MVSLVRDGGMRGEKRTWIIPTGMMGVASMGYFVVAVWNSGVFDLAIFPDEQNFRDQGIVDWLQGRSAIVLSELSHVHVCAGRPSSIFDSYNYSDSDTLQRESHPRVLPFHRARHDYF